MGTCSIRVGWERVPCDLVFSYYSAYRVGKDLGRDLKVILIVFGRCLVMFLNKVGGHIGMFWLLLFILFQYSFQMMRSLCQEECEADVKINAKPMSRYCEADVKTCASNLVLKQITGTDQICYSR